MITALEFWISLKYLRSKRKESFISIVSGFSLVGIMLGVATLIIVMSVMNGFHKEFLKNVLGIQGHITLISKGGNIKEYEALSEVATQIEGVNFAAPIIIGEAMASNGRATEGVEVRAIEGDLLERKPMIKESLDDDAIAEFKAGEGIIVGKVLGEKLGLSTGSLIKIITPEASSTILGAIPRMKTYKVAGFFDVGLYIYNAKTIFMPLQEGQLLFRMPNSVSEIEVMVDDPENLTSVENELIEMGGDYIRVIDWEQAQASFLNALAVERHVMFLILTLIIMVAAFNIISSLIMLVQDKTHNIAILRTMGMGRKSTLKIFIICGSLIGIVGTAIGTLLGCAIAANLDGIKRFLESLTGTKLFDPLIYFLSKLPSDLDPANIIPIVLMAIGFSILATIYPAWRAASLKPAQVLRYE